MKTAPCVFSLLSFYDHPFPLLAPCSWCAEERCILGFLRFLQPTFSGPFYSSRELHTLEPTSFLHSPPLNAAQSSLTEFCWIAVKDEMNMIALRSRLERKEVTDPRRQYLLPATPFFQHFHHRSSTACIAGTRISSWALGLEICVFSLIYLVGFAWIF